VRCGRRRGGLHPAQAVQPEPCKSSWWLVAKDESNKAIGSLRKTEPAIALLVAFVILRPPLVCCSPHPSHHHHYLPTYYTAFHSNSTVLIANSLSLSLSLNHHHHQQQQEDLDCPSWDRHLPICEAPTRTRRRRKRRSANTSHHQARLVLVARRSERDNWVRPMPNCPTVSHSFQYHRHYHYHYHYHHVISPIIATSLTPPVANVSLLAF
jgi:hypothetical protein